MILAIKSSLDSVTGSGLTVVVVVVVVIGAGVVDVAKNSSLSLSLNSSSTHLEYVGSKTIVSGHPRTRGTRGPLATFRCIKHQDKVYIDGCLNAL